MPSPDEPPAPARRGPDPLDRLLAWLAWAALERPWRVVVATVVPTLAAATLALGVPFDLSFTGILPADQPEVARYLAITEELNLGGELYVLLEGPEERLDEAVAACEALADEPGVTRVIAGPPVEWLTAQAPWVVDGPTFDAWLALADPARLGEAAALAEKLAGLRDQLAPPPGKRLVQVLLDRRPMEYRAGESPALPLQDRSSALVAPFGVQSHVTGIAAISAQDQRRTLQRSQQLTPLSLLLVLVVLWWAERRASHLLLMAIPMVLAMAGTLGVVGRLTGEFTLLETFFGVVVFGLGVDFGLHLTTRMGEERDAGHDFAGALRRTLPGTGRGIASGAATTAGAFLVLALAPDPVALHLGLSGGIGLLWCGALMLSLLPALWVLAERPHRPATRTHAELRWLGVLAGVAARAPRRTLLVGGGLVAVLLSGARSYRFETDLEGLLNREVPAFETGRRVQEAFGVDANPWVVIAADLADVRRIEAGIAADPQFRGTFSAAALVRADQPERRARLVEQAERIESTRALLRQLSLFAPPARARALADATNALIRLQQAAAAGPPTLDDLPLDLAERLVLPDGRLAIYVYPAQPSYDSVDARREREALQALAPETTGFGAVVEALVYGDRSWLPLVFLGIFGVVFVVLASDLRDPRWIAAAVVPVLAGTLATFGILCVALPGFNIMTLLAVPLLLGLGVDDGIHVVHRIREHPEWGPAAAAAGVGQAILLTTLTTVVSFGTLLFTDHPGMESLASVVIVGLPLCLLASVTLLPALAVLIAEREPSPREAP